MLDKIGLDTGSGHILVGLLLVVAAIGCAVQNVENGITTALLVLATQSLRESLKVTGDNT